jgi:hypothetical protein
MRGHDEDGGRGGDSLSGFFTLEQRRKWAKRWGSAKHTLNWRGGPASTQGSRGAALARPVIAGGG